MAEVTKKAWDPWKMYDVTSKEMEAIKERAKMKSTLKAEWQKKSTSPYRGVGGYIFDPQLQRFYSMRVTGFPYFKITLKSVAIGFNIVVLPIAILGYLVHTEREGNEKKIRNGEIMYKDRINKFI